MAYAYGASSEAVLLMFKHYKESQSGLIAHWESSTNRLILKPLSD